MAVAEPPVTGHAAATERRVGEVERLETGNVAGIGEEYSPEALTGRLVAVVTNLKSAKLMGVESDGMLVAANDEGRPVLVDFSEPVKIGARLK